VPGLTATFENLTNFNLLANNSATVPGLQLMSSDTNIAEVLSNNLLRTGNPGTVTLTASYMGLTNVQTITITNLGQLTHRYSFTNDASDAVGQVNGILRGNAAVSGGQLVLDATEGTYLELPGGLLEGYDAATIDIWVTFNAAATWARLWYFGDDRANEFYFAPSVLDGNSHWLSTGFPIGGETITRSPRLENQTLHITSVYGNGTMELYTNGVLEGAVTGITGRLDQVGKAFSWIGRSPYQDPFQTAPLTSFESTVARSLPNRSHKSTHLVRIACPNRRLANARPCSHAHQRQSCLQLARICGSVFTAIQHERVWRLVVRCDEHAHYVRT
jgi:hypothetical protein